MRLAVNVTSNLCACYYVKSLSTDLDSAGNYFIVFIYCSYLFHIDVKNHLLHPFTKHGIHSLNLFSATIDWTSLYDDLPSCLPLLTLRRTDFLTKSMAVHSYECEFKALVLSWFSLTESFASKKLNEAQNFDGVRKVYLLEGIADDWDIAGYIRSKTHTLLIRLFKVGANYYNDHSGRVHGFMQCGKAVTLYIFLHIICMLHCAQKIEIHHCVYNNVYLGIINSKTTRFGLNKIIINIYICKAVWRD